MTITMFNTIRLPACTFVLALSACSSQPPGQAPGTWAIQTSATAGSALIYSEHGDESLRIACRRNPVDVLVTTPRLPGQTGPAHLQIGDTRVDLVATGDEPVLVATGRLDAAFAAAMASGDSISVHRSPTESAVFHRPDATTANTFASLCRELTR